MAGLPRMASLPRNASASGVPIFSSRLSASVSTRETKKLTTESHSRGVTAGADEPVESTHVDLDPPGAASPSRPDYPDPGLCQYR